MNATLVNAKLLSKEFIKMDYKIEQLEKMLAAEQAQPENEQYGAHLTHWAGTSKSIHIDERAIEALIRHYKRRLGRKINLIQN